MTTFIGCPAGENISKRKMERAAACIATRETSIQELVSKGSEKSNKVELFAIIRIEWIPRNAVGEIIPVLLATTIAIPDSRNGTVKSTSLSLSELIWRYQVF